MAALERRDTRGVISAVYETLQRIDESVRHRFATENADDSAH
jgi:hypothetical protein